MERRPRGKHSWRAYVPRLGWEQLGVPERSEGAGGDRKVWGSLLKLSSPVTQSWIRHSTVHEWMDEHVSVSQSLYTKHTGGLCFFLAPSL